MVSCREAGVWLLGLSLLYAGVGCAGPPHWNEAAIENPGAAAQARAVSDAPAAQPTTIRQVSAEAPAKPAFDSPAANSSSENPAARLRTLQRLAEQRYATVDSYIARVRRREQVNGKDKPEELLLFKFRKEPWSVYFKFLGSEGRGREVVFVQGQHGSLIHTLLAAGDMPFAPAGKRVALAPDNFFVRSCSRHAITEAGLGDTIERFGRLLDYTERGDKKLGTVKYVGPIQRPEFDVPLEVAEQGILPGTDASMPRGGRRSIMFEPSSHLPLMEIVQDETGHEVEYICYDRLEAPVKLDDDDFNPDKLWPTKDKVTQTKSP
jgi:hypothetical protein